jgi:hypothetical protein
MMFNSVTLIDITGGQTGDEVRAQALRTARDNGQVIDILDSSSDEHNAEPPDEQLVGVIAKIERLEAEFAKHSTKLADEKYRYHKEKGGRGGLTDHARDEPFHKRHRQLGTETVRTRKLRDTLLAKEHAERETGSERERRALQRQDEQLVGVIANIEPLEAECAKTGLGLTSRSTDTT